MIKKDKQKNALMALQAILISARSKAYELDGGQQLAELLDYAEYLPYLIASAEDLTEEYTMSIEEVSKKYGLENVLLAYCGRVRE